MKCTEVLRFIHFHIALHTDEYEFHILQPVCFKSQLLQHVHRRTGAAMHKYALVALNDRKGLCG